jgi:hypothetical protein
MPEGTAVAVPASARPFVARAREDLARRLDLSPAAIRLLSVEAVDWPDAGLGCPQHRLLYPDVVTPGFRVVLEAQDQTYAYHTDTVQLVVLCDERRASEGTPSKAPDTAVEDGWPSQPLEGGHVDTDRITPLAPQDRQ